MGGLGLFGLVFPEAYGARAPRSPRCASPSRRSGGPTSLGITLSAGVGLGANPIFSFGTEEQRQLAADMVAGRASAPSVDRARRRQRRRGHRTKATSTRPPTSG
jgi:alkylation response protein AidB-like acyl-CoA dehydrogenase